MTLSKGDLKGQSGFHFQVAVTVQFKFVNEKQKKRKAIKQLIIIKQLQPRFLSAVKIV